MPTIRIHTPAQLPWSRIRDRAGDPPPKVFQQLADSELDSAMVFHEFGGASELQLAELEYLPGAEAVPHWHDDDEIIYVLRGELHLGQQVLGPGASVYIPGNTCYGFFAGPTGLRILNFRATADVSFYPKAQ